MDIFEGLQTLTVSQQAWVFEDGEHVVRCRPSDCAVPSSRMIDSSSLARSRWRPSSMTWSTMNMTSCRSVAAAVDDMSAVLDLCSLKHNSSAYNATVAYSRFIRTRYERRGRTKVKLTYAV